MRRNIGRAAVFAAVVTGGLVFPVLGAHADSPSLFGWWISTNQGTVSGAPIPTLVPNQNYGYQDPANDIPSGGFEVTNVGPHMSYAAIGYTAYGATVNQVVLSLAPNANDLPNSTVQACPLTSDKPFQPEAAGPTSDGPAYDCTTAVPGVPSSDGQTISFAVGNLVRNNYLGIAIVAGNASRLVFNHAGDNTVQVTQAPSTDSVSPDVSATSSSPAVTATDQSSAPAATSGGDQSALAAPSAQATVDQTGPSGPSLAGTPAAAPAAASPAGAPAAPAASQPLQMVAVSAPTASIGVGSAAVGALLVGAAALGTIRRNRRLARAAADGPPPEE